MLLHWGNAETKHASHQIDFELNAIFAAHVNLHGVHFRFNSLPILDNFVNFDDAFNKSVGYHLMGTASCCNINNPHTNKIVNIAACSRPDSGDNWPYFVGCIKRGQSSAPSGRGPVRGRVWYLKRHQTLHVCCIVTALYDAYNTAKDEVIKAGFQIMSVEIDRKPWQRRQSVGHTLTAVSRADHKLYRSLVQGLHMLPQHLQSGCKSSLKIVNLYK